MILSEKIWSLPSVCYACEGVMEMRGYLFLVEADLLVEEDLLVLAFLVANRLLRAIIILIIEDRGKL